MFCGECGCVRCKETLHVVLALKPQITDMVHIGKVIHTENITAT